MLLFASLMNDNRWHELLAEVQVTSDSHEPWDDDCIRRSIEGMVVRRGLIWEPFIKLWQSVAQSMGTMLPPHMGPGEVDGHEYFMVRLLQVDHDLYTNTPYMNVEGNT